MKDVNIFLGRFQPFTAGHLKVLEQGYKKNGLSTVVLMIQNNKMDDRHPFSDDLIQKEMEIIRKNHPELIEDTIYIKSADILKFAEELHNKDYEPVLWLTGTDRLAQYTKMAENYKERANFKPEFTTFEIQRGDDDISATKVRESIKAEDMDTFKSMMPKGTDKLFDEFAVALKEAKPAEVKKPKRKKIKEGMMSLRDYILEALRNE